MENENPKYLNCPWCPAQSFLTGWVDINQAKYECPAHHTFYIEKETYGIADSASRISE